MTERSNGVAVGGAADAGVGGTGAGARLRARLSAIDARDLAFVGASVAILAAAIALRVPFLGDREVFRDEASSWLAASLPFPDLFSRVAGEPYPPLYALLLKGWMAAWGDGAGALRGFSVVCNLVAIVAAWRWAREALGRPAAIVVAALVAFAPMSIYEARNARMYALETAFATLSWWLAWRLTRADGSDAVDAATGSGGEGWSVHRKATAVALAICVAGEVWTMAYGIPIAGLQLLTTAFLGWRQRRYLAPAAVFVGGLSYLPWLPLVLTSSALSGKFWTGVPDLAGLGQTLAVWAGAGYALPLDFTIAVVLPAAAIGLVRLARARRTPLLLVLVAGIGLAPALWLVSQVHPLFDQRYFGPIMAPIGMAFAAAIAPGVRAARDPSRRTASVEPRTSVLRARPARGWVRPLQVAAALVVLVPTAVGGIVSIPDWRGGQGTAPAAAAMQAVAAHMQPGDVVLTPDTRTYFLAAYYAERSTDPIRLPGPVYDWHTDGEPFYFGGSLVAPNDRVEAATASRVGLRAAIPGLGANGHVWLVALANNNRIQGFDPLFDGRVRVVGTFDVNVNGAAGYVRELEVLS